MPTVSTRTGFSKADRIKIHQAASRLVLQAVHAQTSRDLLPTELAEREIDGLFVTLKRGHTLRGCCGMHSTRLSLRDALQRAAVRTATNDPRMTPVSVDELAYLDLSVSILGAPRAIEVSGTQRADAVVVGTHGLRIRLGDKAGLLLPSVARERNWNSRQFLNAVCRKAGLPEESWQRDDATVMIFNGIDFSAPLMVPDERTQASTTSASSTTQAPHTGRIKALQKWLAVNLNVPAEKNHSITPPEAVSDQLIHGVALQVAVKEKPTPIQSMQFTVRGGLSLHQILVNLATQVSKELAANHYTVASIDCAVLSDAIHHGNGNDIDLRGVDCHQRAILILNGRQSTLSFDRASSPAKLYNSARTSQHFETTGLQAFSLICESSTDTLRLVTKKRVTKPPVKTDIPASIRVPAVAGRFYPDTDTARIQTIDAMLQKLSVAPKQTIATAIVPHAGLKYSGPTACDVWRRIKLPDTVIIIGPKHTSAGANWAVAPHSEWRISDNTSVTGNPALARQFAAAVPGMELDAEAHQLEHGIEVQLPILHRISPSTRVVGVAMAGGTTDTLRTAAKSLATWIKHLPDPPLLVISSDMNHFANDKETRRRDRLALQQLQRNNPEGLLKVCRDEAISMCGQIPAAFVLMALGELRPQLRYQEIHYATSADCSGDKSRVVGYAGIIYD